MEKPISMIINETKMNLARICNESQLPTYILEPILKDLFEEARMLNEKQLQQDKMLYQQSLIEEQNKANNLNTNEESN